jgi:hypothetical protein
MATDSVDIFSAGSQASRSFARFADRWIWVFMAALFIAAVLIGFVPDSIVQVRAIQAHTRPPFRWFLHIHAVVMGSWMLVLLLQTVLMATGRRHGHAALGVASLALAPLVVAMMIVMTWTGPFGGIVAAFTQRMPLSVFSIGLGGAFFLQGRSIVLFTTFYIWGLLTRRTAPESHKRMMILATLSIIDAGLARFLGATEPGLALGQALHRVELSEVWLLAMLLPVLLYDTVRRGRIHYAWGVGATLFLPFFVVFHVLTVAPPWWLGILASITGRYWKH